MLTHVRMQYPERAVFDINIFYQHVFTAIEMHEVGTQVGTFIIHFTGFHRIAFRCHMIKIRQRLHMFRRTLIPNFPGIQVGKKLAFTAERNVLASVSVNKRRVVITLHAFPGCFYSG